MRFPIILISLIWFVVAIIFGSKIGPQTEQEEFIDADHPIMKPIKIIQTKFGASAETGQEAFVYFGVEGVDNSEEDQWDPMWNNKAIFDKDFTIKPIKNQ